VAKYGATPDLPPNPIKASVSRRRAQDEPSLDDKGPGQMNDLSARRLGRETRGPITNRRDVIQQLGDADHRRKPIDLKSSRSMRGGKR